MEFSGCLDDASFGPAVQGCRDDFDFTIKFEKIFLSIIPAAVFVACSLSRIVYLVRQPSIVGGTALRTTKLIAITVYATLQLALLILCGTKLTKLASFFIGASTVTFISGLCIGGLSFLEHSRSPRPSMLLNGYLFLTTLFDVVQTRTLWLAASSNDEFTYSRLFTTALVVKAALVLVESQQKTKWVRWDIKEHSPEETSGLFGIGAFFWLNRLFLVGFKKNLTMDDLFPLDTNMTTEALHARLAAKVEASHKKGEKYGLAKALIKTLAVPLLLPVGPRIALTAFQFCQPFLINTVLEFLQKSEEDSTHNISIGLIGATILIYSGIACSAAFYWYLQERAMWMARGALAGAVYKKTTEARLSAADDSAALTLMSADVERIRTGFLNLHEFWANMIEVALASWLLERQLGAAFAAPVVVVLLCACCSAFLTRLNGPRQKAWMQRIQKRVGLTANVITHMKHLKISGLTAPVETLIQKLRVDELDTGSRFRMLLCYSAIIAFTPITISPVVTFGVTSRELNVTTIFTSYSYLILLAQPLSMFFQSIPAFLAGFTCLGRIQAFMEKDGRYDFRESEFSQSKEKVVAEGVEGPNTDDGSRSVMKISGGKFGWEPGKPNLKDLDLNIPPSRLTIVVGPIASGKSTLCKVLLGETPESEGQVVMGRLSRRVGYCDQTPYLNNATVRENIVGYAPFDQKRYREVIDATVLEPDLAILPKGDKSKIGSNGITLSGGQKQRVSMARALYLDTNFFVFDDILSGLDADTEEQVFRRVFGPSGLLRRRNATTVLCTHSVRHLPSADHIVALGSDGSLVEQGTFQDLMSNKKYVHSLGIKIGEPTPDDDILPAGQEPKPEDLKQALSAKSTGATDGNEPNRMVRDRAVFRHYFGSMKVVTLAIFFTFSCGFGFFQNWGSIWLKFWSEDISSAHPVRSNAFYAGLYALFQVSCLLSIFIACVTTVTTMIKQSGGKLHNDALRTVITAPLRFFTTTDTGIVLNLFSQDLTLIDGELPMALLNLGLDGFSAIAMAAVIATSSPFLCITYPFIALLLYLIQKFYLRTSRQLRLLDLEAKSPLYTHFLDTIKGVATFRAFGWVHEGINLNNRLVDTSQRPAYQLAMIQRWLAFILQLAIMCLAVTIVSLVTQLRSNTAFTGASLISLMTFGDMLTYIVRCYTLLETSIGAVSRLRGFSERVKPEDQDDEDVIPAAEWPLKGGIEINGVSASYGDIEEAERESASSSGSSTHSSRNLALKDLHLSIAPGEKVAICGRSGSGKSSAMLLLLRLLDPLPSCSENITIDSTPLHKIDRSTLRQRIIAVPQEPVFLPDGTSIKSNLDPFDVATEADCRAVLEAVDLWNFVADRGGLEAGLTADTLSQGQKQLFSLARAIVRRRIRAARAAGEVGEKAEVGGILLLDEVSSSVDQDTDRAMQAIIQEEFKGYTIVMVSHRLDMVMDFDTVVVMDKGRIVETGRPRTLVEREGSRFRELWMIKNKG